jgi:hypothetical protein
MRLSLSGLPASAAWSLTSCRHEIRNGAAPMIRHVTNRRAFLGTGAGLAGVTLVGALVPALARQVVKEIHELLPGEFTWHPERSPKGPVAVVVSIPEQRVHIYRNGVRIAVATCSTGAPGHATPTGVFTVLQKDKHHRSSTYNNAPMPNMNRLTWSGIALHAGKLPGYPASHGCVRLPLEFSAKLFTVTHIGTPVIIAGAHTDPWELIHPGMVLGAYAEHEFEDAVAHPVSGMRPRHGASRKPDHHCALWIVGVRPRRPLSRSARHSSRNPEGTIDESHSRRARGGPASCGLCPVRAVAARCPGSSRRGVRREGRFRHAGGTGPVRCHGADSLCPGCRPADGPVPDGRGP